MSASADELSAPAAMPQPQQQQQSQSNRKYQSPPPPPDSMTPPPSSQPASRSVVTAVARTPTPTHSHLSSPPPTAALKPATAHDGIPGVFSPEQVADASADELRGMISDTQLAYREARAAAAHKTLQYNLLTMETSEAINRMSVELSMSRKEVEVLQSSRHSSAMLTPVMHARGINTISPPDEQVIKNLREKVQQLELDNHDLRNRLENAKMFILEREGAHREESDMLRNRIRKNREHINLIRQLDVPPMSTQTTPSRARQHPSVAKPQHEEPFAALLLADQVLSQEAATSSPSTPQPRRPHHHASHTRGSHSLSSLPSTPLHARTAPAQSRQYQAAVDRPSPLRHRPSAAPAPLPPAYDNTPRRRQDDRDSTISASEGDDSDSEPDIPTSQASQEAADMLRRSAHSSFRAANHPPTPTSAKTAKQHAGSSSGLYQTKLFGQVTKPGAQASPSAKRKASSTVHESPRGKKGRTEGVGLGIGGWASSR